MATPQLPSSHFFKKPNSDAVLVHSYPATPQEHGVQALIVCRPSETSSAIVGLPNSSAGKLVYLQVSSRSQCFVSHDAAPNACELPLDVYLSILQFFAEDFARLETKINMEIKSMRERNALVNIEPGLEFLGGGFCIFQHFFNADTVLEVRAESKSANDDFFVHLTVGKKSLQLYVRALQTLAANLPTLKKLTAAFCQSGNGR